MSSELWKDVLSWLKDNIVMESFNELGLFLGIFEETEDFFIIKNHVLLLGKYYIYVRKCLGSLPSLRGFIARIRSLYNIKLHTKLHRGREINYNSGQIVLENGKDKLITVIPSE